ncbi:MAG: cupin domain-containing protein [Candidatus Krumholzibacteriota bacterium]|nr:cupin domain-containing protein [Candidatus Krumholzibacteriota bacterium]
MKLMKALDVEEKEVEMDGAENVTIRWLISKDDGAPNFAMRMFELGPGGHSPLHSHSWEHEVYIVDGDGKLIFDGEEKPFSSGDFIFVPPDRQHSFINTGENKMRFLCLVPND